MDSAPSENEWVIAAAAWASIHYLTPIPLAEDDIAAAIRWKENIRYVTDLGEMLFPSYPHGFEEPVFSPDTLEIANRVLPAGNNKALWLYHFFECTTDAAATNPRAVLAALSAALRDRRLQSEIAPVRIGPLIIGSLGVISLHPHTHGREGVTWFGSDAMRGSYAEYGRALSVTVNGVIPSIHCQDNYRCCYGWSTAWSEWHRLSGPIQDCSREGEDRWYVSYRRRTGPTPADSHRSAYADPLGLWPQFALRVVLSLDQKKLSQVLDDCIQHNKGVFFTGTNWTHAPDGHAILTHKRSEMDASGIRQLLLVAPAETVVASAIEHEYYTPRRNWGASFSECVTAALLRVYTDSACRGQLEPFIRNAGGSDYDRVLHWIVKADPTKVLEHHIHLSAPIAEAIARLTCAPLAFHKSAGGDQSDACKLAALFEYVRRFLGDEQVPTAPERALPFDGLPRITLSGMSAIDQLSGVRRRTEYLFKTAIQYLYALLAWHKLVPNAWPDNCRELSYRPLNLMYFWDDQPFVRAITNGLKTASGASLEVPGDAKLLLSDLRTLLSALGNLVTPGSPAELLAVRNAQKLIDSALSEPRLMEYVNDPNHDNASTLRRIGEIREKLAAFDSRVRRINDALPPFAVFVKSTVEPNRPKLVSVEPYSQLGIIHDNFKHEHYITNRDMELRRDRVYSLTDVTRNQVSINPIIFDWTDWMRWSGIPES